MSNKWNVAAASKQGAGSVAQYFIAQGANLYSLLSQVSLPLFLFKASAFVTLKVCE